MSMKKSYITSGSGLPVNVPTGLIPGFLRGSYHVTVELVEDCGEFMITQWWGVYGDGELPLIQWIM